MKATKDGVIINLASVSGLRPRSGGSAYASAKAAVIHLSKELALELAPFNIRVNSICPVIVDTPMLPKFKPEGMPIETVPKSDDRYHSSRPYS